MMQIPDVLNRNVTISRTYTHTHTLKLMQARARSEDHVERHLVIKHLHYVTTDSSTCQRSLPSSVIRHDPLLPFSVLGLGLQAGIQRLHRSVQKSALLLRILQHLNDSVC